jgi:hypothetical protein
MGTDEAKHNSSACALGPSGLHPLHPSLGPYYEELADALF